MSLCAKKVGLATLNARLKKDVNAELKKRHLPKLTDGDAHSFIVGEYEGQKDSVNASMLLMSGLSAVIAIGAFLVATVSIDDSPADSRLIPAVLLIVVYVLTVAALVVASIAAFSVLARRTEHKTKVNAIVIRILVDRSVRDNAETKRIPIARDVKVYALTHQTFGCSDAEKRPRLDQ